MLTISSDSILLADWELLTGCYSLEPWEKIAFSAFPAFDLRHSYFADFFRSMYSRVSSFLLHIWLYHSRADFFFFVSLAGVIFYGYKNVSTFVKSFQ